MTKITLDMLKNGLIFYDGAPRGHIEIIYLNKQDRIVLGEPAIYQNTLSDLDDIKELIWLDENSYFAERLKKSTEEPEDSPE